MDAATPAVEEAKGEGGEGGEQQQQQQQQPERQQQPEQQPEKPKRVRKPRPAAPKAVAAGLAPPPVVVDGAFFAGLLSTQRTLEKERRVAKLSNLAIA